MIFDLNTIDLNATEKVLVLIGVGGAWFNGRFFGRNR